MHSPFVSTESDQASTFNSRVASHNIERPFNYSADLVLCKGHLKLRMTHHHICWKTNAHLFYKVLEKSRAHNKEVAWQQIKMNMVEYSRKSDKWIARVRWWKKSLEHTNMWLQEIFPSRWNKACRLIKPINRHATTMECGVEPINSQTIREPRVTQIKLCWEPISSPI